MTQSPGARATRRSWDHGGQLCRSWHLGGRGQRERCSGSQPTPRPLQRPRSETRSQGVSTRQSRATVGNRAEKEQAADHHADPIKSEGGAAPEGLLHWAALVSETGHHSENMVAGTQHLCLCKRGQSVLPRVFCLILQPPPPPRSFIQLLRELVKPCQVSFSGSESAKDGAVSTLPAAAADPMPGTLCEGKGARGRRPSAISTASGLAAPDGAAERGSADTPEDGAPRPTTRMGTVSLQLSVT